MTADYSGSKIGCNIVDPVCDEADNYTLSVYLKNIEKYREYGIFYVEFSHVTALDKESAVKINAFCRNVRTVPWSVHSEHLNDEGRQAMEKYMRIQTHCAEIARALGAKVMVCHIPNLKPRGEAFERDMDILTRLADITRRCGVRLAIETDPADYIIRLVDTINRDDVGMNLDTGHSFLKDGGDPAETARKIGKRLFTTHLQDNFGTHDDHQPPGLGRIDWLSTMRALKEIGYDGPLMMEMTGTANKQHRVDGYLKELQLEKEIIFAAAYLDFLNRKIKTKGVPGVG